MERIDPLKTNSLRDIKIFLKEDKPADAELILMAIKKKYNIDNIKRVRSGEEAIEFLDDINNHITEEGKNSLILIILALFLPRMSGIEVLKHIKKTELNKYVPVVIFTSSEDKVHMAESYDLHANSYIVKPTDYKELTAAVDDMVQYWCKKNKLPH